MKTLVSKRANQDFLGISEYLEYRWGLGSVEKFKSITNGFLDIVESFLEIGSLEFPEKTRYSRFSTSRTDQGISNPGTGGWDCKSLSPWPVSSQAT